MKSLLLAAIVTAGLMFGAASTAEAGGPHHGHHGHHVHHRHHGHYNYHRGHGHPHVYRSYYRPSYYGRSYYRPSYRYYRPYPYYGGSGIQINGRGFNFGVRF